MATYTLTGPSTGQEVVASTNFTVTMDSTSITGTVVVTPSDGGAGGTFTPTTLSFTTANQAKTFTYTPARTGKMTISTTNGSSYTNPAALTYTSTLNYQDVLNRILYAEDKGRGGFFYWEILRQAGLSVTDMDAVRTAYNTYKTTRESYPTPTINKEDLGANIHGTALVNGQTKSVWR